MEDDFEIPTAGKFNEEEGIGEDMDVPEGEPVGKVGEENEIGKDGLKKKIIKEGDGWESPINGDEVEGNIHLFKIEYINHFMISYFLCFCMMDFDLGMILLK